jgi:hypothetical protein
MEGLGVGVVIVLAIGFGIGLWMLSMGLDKSRITDYVEQRRGRVVSISWAPFGKGWFGEKQERLYEVVYYDSDGNQHFATAKTSMLTGVFWTDDRVTHSKSAWYDSLPPSNQPGKPLMGQIPKEATSDESEELRRLREENARLRAQLSRRGSTEITSQPETCPACGTIVGTDAARCPHCQTLLR